jgi:MFS family permease
VNIRLSPTTRALLRLYSTSLAMSLGQGMTIPTIPVLKSHFNLSFGLAAQVVTLYALGRLFSTIPAGLAVDRLGRKSTMLLGATLVAAGALTTALTPDFRLVLLAQFLAGAGDSLWFLGREVAGVDLVRPEQRGRLMSGFMGISSGGMTLGPFIGGVVTQALNFRVVFLAYTVIAVAVVLVTLLVRDSRPPESRPVQTSPVAAIWPLVKVFALGLFSALTSLLKPAVLLIILSRLWAVAAAARHISKIRDVLRPIEPHNRATYLSLVFATFAMMLYRLALQSMLPLYAGSYLGFSPTQVGSLFLISGLFVLIMIIPTGFITDKIGRKWATVPSTALPAVVFAAMPFAHSMLQLSLLAVVIGMANGMSLGSYATSTYDIIPAAERGRLQSIRRFVGEMGAISGPGLGGIIANTFHPGITFLVYAPLLLMAALGLAFVARETLVKQRRAAPA